MSYVLDTATLLWAVAEPERLSRRARRICEAPATRLVVSVVSLSEVAIKTQKGMLEIPDPAGWLDSAVTRLGADVLPVRAAHVYQLLNLPPVHKDPFDRMLVAQALTERIPLVTNDPLVHRYPVKCVW